MKARNVCSVNWSVKMIDGVEMIIPVSWIEELMEIWGFMMRRKGRVFMGFCCVERRRRWKKWRREMKRVKFYNTWNSLESWRNATQCTISAVNCRKCAHISAVDCRNHAPQISTPSLITSSAVLCRNSAPFSADNCRKCAPQFLIFFDTNFGSSLPKSCTNFGRQVPKLSTEVNLTFFTFS